MQTALDKTLFIGKQFVYLSTVTSTNDYAKKIFESGDFNHGAVVIAASQTAGRGQRDNHWESESEANLLCSIILQEDLPIDRQFLISKCISLAIAETVSDITAEDTFIKWPNDIIVQDKKIAGILIENMLQGNQLLASIVGFGLNINQTDFPNLPGAISVKSLLGKTQDTLEVMNTIALHLEKQLALMHADEFLLNKSYNNRLLYYNTPRSFKTINGDIVGNIIGTNNQGQLLIQQADIVQAFNHGEIFL